MYFVRLFALGLRDHLDLLIYQFSQFLSHLDELLSLLRQKLFPVVYHFYNCRFHQLLDNLDVSVGVILLDTIL